MVGEELVQLFGRRHSLGHRPPVARPGRPREGVPVREQRVGDVLARCRHRLCGGLLEAGRHRT